MNKKTILSIAALSGVIIASYAADYLWFNASNGVSTGIEISKIKSITYANGYDDVAIEIEDGNQLTSTALLNDVTPGDALNVVDIVYDNENTTVRNPFLLDGVSIEKDGAKVTVTSTSNNEITYHLTGSADAASFKIYSTKKYVLQLDNVSITNDKGAAINSQSSKKCTVELIGESTLTDSKKYSTPDGEDEKGCFFSEGQIVFTGSGLLNVSGKKKHAIVSDDYIEIQDGTVKVLSAASDGIHVNDYFIMTGGSFISSSTEGDGIDADAGYIDINGGSIDISIATEDTKGIKCDDRINMTGGDIKLTVSGDQCKGIRTKSTFTLDGGKITANLSGNVVVTDGDPSYCTAIKPQDFVMNNGEIEITHTGTAGKGLSIDGDCTFNGGTINITSSGNGGIYQDVNGDNDSYSSTCISVDGNVNILAGSFNLSNSGTAGKCIKGDNDITFGDANHSPLITASTSGAKILESSSSNNWGGWGPGGGGNSADYANPKVIKAGGNLTVNNGDFTLSSTKDGGEGLESKNILTINGGTIAIETIDDCINASNSIVVNDGKIYCKASNNDAIDSNGTITINGGLIVAIGASSPECGFDCDNNTFKITGGTIFAIAGSTSNPTTSVCTQPIVKYTASVTANSRITITDSNTSPIMSFSVPSGISGSRVMLFTSPKIATGQSYSIYTGGSITNGDTFKNLTTGGSYTTGTQSTTFTPSSMLTTLGSSNGGWGGH
jgi:hypothetical protein